MIGYAPILGQVPLTKPLAYRPLAFVGGPKMGQKSTIAAIGTIPLLVGTAISGGIAWLGFSIGSKQKGVMSAIGYTVGVVGGLSAVGGLVATSMWLLGVSLMQEPTPATAPPNPTMPALPEGWMTPRTQMPQMPRFTDTTP